MARAFYRHQRLISVVHKTKRETVNEAFEEYINRRKRRAALDLLGKVEFVPSFDYKRARRRR